MDDGSAYELGYGNALAVSNFAHPKISLPTLSYAQ
jgi:hypothetical protein